MKKSLIILAMLICPNAYAATLTANTVPYVCQGGTNPQLCNSKVNVDNQGNIVLAGLVPKGVIVMWSGSIASIPSGWNLCDGTNGTPDLRNRFVVGAVADQSGIAKTTVTDPVTPIYTQSGNGQLPSTTITSFYDAQFGDRGPNNNVDAFTYDSGNPVTLSFGTGSLNVAVYYALAYIMKT